MTTSEIKTDLHFLIDNINDESILNAVRTILKKQIKTKTDWADELNEGLRKELNESILEANKGTVISHTEAMKQIKIRYNL
jgi:predicted transcriptional regulator